MPEFKKTKEDEEYLARRKERNKALKASFDKDHPKEKSASLRSGAEIDAEIAALQERVSALETSDAAQNARLTALEEGGEAPTPEPPDPEPPSGKRFPDVDDPMCGVPAGTSLSNAGATTISQDGAKVSGKKFSGRVVITGANVELFNCEINTGDWWGIEVKAPGANIHHCNIISTATNGNSGVNTSDGTKITYCKFRGWENIVNLAGDNNVIEWNDSKGLKGNSDSHYDNIQCDGGTRGHRIRHNRMNCEYGQTSACMIDNYFGKIEDVIAEDNWFGGGGYTVYLDGSFKGSSNAIGIIYRNNVMKRGGWGYIYWKSAGSGCSHTGNVDASTGASVD